MIWSSRFDRLNRTLLAVATFGLFASLLLSGCTKEPPARDASKGALELVAGEALRISQLDLPGRDLQTWAVVAQVESVVAFSAELAWHFSSDSPLGPGYGCAVGILNTEPLFPFVTMAGDGAPAAYRRLAFGYRQDGDGQFLEVQPLDSGVVFTPLKIVLLNPGETVALTLAFDGAAWGDSASLAAHIKVDTGEVTVTRTKTGNFDCLSMPQDFRWGQVEAAGFAMTASRLHTNFEVNQTLHLQYRVAASEGLELRLRRPDGTVAIEKFVLGEDQGTYCEATPGTWTLEIPTFGGRGTEPLWTRIVAIDSSHSPCPSPAQGVPD
jgi:hypothetical protein